MLQKQIGQGQSILLIFIASFYTVKQYMNPQEYKTLTTISLCGKCNHARVDK